MVNGLECLLRSHVAQHNFQTRGAFFDILWGGAVILRLWCTHRTGKRTSDARPCTERTGKRRDRSTADPTSRPGRLTYTTRTLRWSLSGKLTRTNPRANEVVGGAKSRPRMRRARFARLGTDGRTDSGRRLLPSYHMEESSCHHSIISSFHHISISSFQHIIIS